MKQKAVILACVILFVYAGGGVAAADREPLLLKIPTLSLEAEVEGLTRKEMEALPPDGSKVFWYKDGVTPGDRGSAVLAGHYDDYEGPAVFYQLVQLEQGDLLYLIDRGGLVTTYQVESVRSFPKEAEAVADVFTVNHGASLQLVTCSGVYRQLEQTHSHRLIVTAKKRGDSYPYQSSS
ncbi:class F sortase [Alkalihalobacillus oceani]|uniref:class F sortase n=1 Tax=Halalkalibacter oceani TaxID=1653776 RepID=UPI00203EE4E5|nr:class F sortase [Halalkalibacter oceani]MCM3763176.1 class F sortase [Halalkalibacter oceani]